MLGRGKYEIKLMKKEVFSILDINLGFRVSKGKNETRIRSLRCPSVYICHLPFSPYRLDVSSKCIP